MKKNAVPTAQKLNKLVRRASGLMALEQRFMFDGAAVADAVDAHLDSVIPVKVGVTSEAVTKALDLVPPALTTNSTPARVELVFIESDVGNYQSLLNGLSPDVEVHVLDAAQDGLAQIAQALAGRSGKVNKGAHGCRV